MIDALSSLWLLGRESTSVESSGNRYNSWDAIAVVQGMLAEEVAGSGLIQNWNASQDGTARGEGTYADREGAWLLLLCRPTSPSFSSIALSFLAPLGVAAAPREATTAQLTSPLNSFVAEYPILPAP